MKEYDVQAFIGGLSRSEMIRVKARSARKATEKAKELVSEFDRENWFGEIVWKVEDEEDEDQG